MINIDNNNRKNIIGDFLPDLTPLLDVVFMLIIFLILAINTASFALEVTLPEDRDDVTKSISDNDHLKIYLLSSNSWQINKKKFSDEQKFKDYLINHHQKHKDQKIIIITDKNSKVGKLISILTFLKKQNIQMADILVEKS
ncbi:biopolymer transporter ExbD [Rickettsiales bacterium]|nr:biopolymer transporter ExbD [Rickettsiales bacterium]